MEPLGGDLQLGDVERHEGQLAEKYSVHPCEWGVEYLLPATLTLFSPGASRGMINRRDMIPIS